MENKENLIGIILEYNKHMRNILWDKISRPHRKPFGLFYPLETCFYAKSFQP